MSVYKIRWIRKDSGWWVSEDGNWNATKLSAHSWLLETNDPKMAEFNGGARRAHRTLRDAKLAAEHEEDKLSRERRELASLISSVAKPFAEALFGDVDTEEWRENEGRDDQVRQQEDGLSL